MPLPITDEQCRALAELRTLNPKVADLAEDIGHAIDPCALVDVGDPMYSRNFLNNLCRQLAQDGGMVAQLLAVWLSRLVGAGVLDSTKAAAFVARAEALAEGGE